MFRVSRYSRLTSVRTCCARRGQTERSGLLSRQVTVGCPTRGGAQKTNRDTTGHRNAIASLSSIKLLPSETTSRRLPRWKPVPRGIKFGSSSAGNIIPANASRCERYSRWYERRSARILRSLLRSFFLLIVGSPIRKPVRASSINPTRDEISLRKCN